MKKLIALLLALVMVIGLAACGGSATTETKAPVATEAPTQAEAPAETEAAGNTTDLPRDETLYFAGQQWGTVNSWNIIGTNQNNAMALAAGAGYRTTMFETLYMWNVMTGELIGLLADGDYTWNDNMTELSVNLKEAAHWSDGTPVTAADVVRTMWGKLPVPKYLAHVIYADNAAGEVALKAGEVDVCQQFIGNIQNLWLEDGLPISTFYDEAPYGVCLTMPTAWYNMNIPVIAENTALRKAIAMAVDYDTIIANAMTNQSPSFSDVPRSLMNPTDGEQALYDHDAVADLQWAGNDIEGAKALLDEAGIVDSDGDGWREWNGEKISLNAVCPNGWTDWQASMEVVAAAGKNIGVEITTLYPEYSIYQTVFVDPDQTEYAIFMWSPDASTPSNPWGRVNQFMGKDYVGIANNWSGNWGQYVNDEAEALIKKIPTTTDTAELKDLYTKLTEIYLTEVPSFSLMYRPSVFHCVNESVWTNFPAGDDGRNIPPADCTDGYGIAALYELELVG